MGDRADRHADQARQLRDAVRRAVRPVPHLHVVAGRGSSPRPTSPPGSRPTAVTRAARRPRQAADEHGRIRPRGPQPAGGQAPGAGPEHRLRARAGRGRRGRGRADRARPRPRRPPSGRHGRRRLRRLVRLLHDRHRRRQLPGAVGARTPGADARGGARAGRQGRGRVALLPLLHRPQGRRDPVPGDACSSCSRSAAWRRG